MGLKITTELYTDDGPSTATYLNVDSINFERNGNFSIKLNNYLNKEARELDPNDKIMCKKLYDRIFIMVEKDTPDFEDLNTKSIYSFAYSKIKEKLVESGLSVEDDL